MTAHLVRLRMRIVAFVLAMLLFTSVIGCIGDADDSLGGEAVPDDVRQAMRDFVIELAGSARMVDANFIVIPQNGNELATSDGSNDGELMHDYLAAIDGQGREDLWFGYATDDAATPVEARGWMLQTLRIAEQQGVEVLVTDYCSSPANVEDSRANADAEGFVSFQADHRSLDDIPTASEVNSSGVDITSLSGVGSFLYLLDTSQFTNRTAYLDALRSTGHDLLIIDAEYEGSPLTGTEVASLKVRADGTTRLVVAYLSIGEAEDYRWYWQDGWVEDPPTWLNEENPDWRGNWKVSYWDADWQAIIYGKPGEAPVQGSGVQRLLDAGFDGAYLDIIDAFEYFE